MKSKKFFGFLGIGLLAVLAVFMPLNVFADDKCGDGVQTVILGNGGCYNNNNGVMDILGLVADIMVGVVGVLAVIGFVVVGIQYMTAGGNEAQMTKAKRRILEIVLGLVLFGCMYGLLKWLGVEVAERDDSGVSSSKVIEQKPTPTPIPTPTQEPVIKPTTEPEPVVDPEPVVEPEPEPVVEADPEPVVEPEPEPVVEPDPEPEPEPEPTREPEPEPEAEERHLEMTENDSYLTLTRVATKKNGAKTGVTLKKGDKIYDGDEIKVGVKLDSNKFAPEIVVNGTTVRNNETFMVDGDVEIEKKENSIHFVRNSVLSTANCEKSNGKCSAIGDSILISSNGHYGLIDTGANASKGFTPNGGYVSLYLKSLGITHLDFIIFTHVHSDHVGGFISSAGVFPIDKNTTVYYKGCDYFEGDSHATLCKKLRTKISESGVKEYSLRDNRVSGKFSVSLGDYKLDFLNIDDNDGDGKPDYVYYKGDADRENLNSLGFIVTNKNSSAKAFLGGDFELALEDKYASRIGQVDLMKMSHHGIFTSNSYEFLSTLKPNKAILPNCLIPRQAPVQYLMDRGTQIYITGDASGQAVVARLNKSNYSINNSKALTYSDDRLLTKQLIQWSYVMKEHPENQELYHTNVPKYFLMTGADNKLLKNTSKTIKKVEYHFGANGLAPAL